MFTETRAMHFQFDYNERVCVCVCEYGTGSMPFPNFRNRCSNNPMHIQPVQHLKQKAQRNIYSCDIGFEF